MSEDAFKIEINDNNDARLIFDLPGEKVNKFTTDVMIELKAHLNVLAGKKELKSLSIISNKENRSLSHLVQLIK